VGDAEGLARDAIEEVSLDGFARGEGDRVHQSVEPVPALAQFGEQRVDLRVFGDVAGEDQLAAEFLGELGERSLKRSFW
jgi:hypothetical protein